ncbi:MAG: hypothetical protein V4663_05970 [Bacteroidota bacterium]
MHREDDNPKTSAAGSDAKEELISVGLNSLWGMIYMIMEKLGMSWYEIMWKRSWINIEMMLADAPRMAKKNKEDTVPTLTGKQLAARRKSRNRK